MESLTFDTHERGWHKQHCRAFCRDLTKMAAVHPNETQDELEEELEFQDVLITSLDPGAFDYSERLAELQAKRSELEDKLNALSSRPQTAQSSQSHMNGMDGSNDQRHGFQNDDWWQATLNGRPSSQNNNSSFAGSSAMHSGGVKRTLPASLRAGSQHPSKRATPEPSNAGTPTSLDSFEWVENPNLDVSERTRRRQLQAEAALRRQREDEEFARQLSQYNNSHPAATPSSSSARPHVQTTLNYSGSYHRPPVKAEPSMAPPQYGNPSWPQSFPETPNTYPTQQSTAQPHIKSEPAYPRQQQLPQRPRKTEVVDLTNEDSDDDEIFEIDPHGFTPNNRAQRPYSNQQQVSHAPAVQPVPYHMSMARQMPGAFPPTNYQSGQSVYNNVPVATQRQGWMQQTNPLLMNAVNGIRNIPGTLQDTFTELSNLIGSSSRPQPLDDDDDVTFSGSRQISGAHNAGYQDLDLYQNRYNAIANYDPAKSQEEINALLENIRPDEDMPEHLRVSTPEAMTIQLHKYQELGLTWLQKCEDGSNKGGILADDMGLGKTIQMLSLIVTHKSEDPRCKTTLIVAPVALMRQWQQEIETKIKPGKYKLSVFIQHGSNKKKDFNDLQHFDVVLTTFGSLAAELKKKEKFWLRQRANPAARPNESEKCALISSDAVWYRVILDEAQCIKNVKTATAKAAQQLHSKFRFCMTGTPMMNNVDELFSLIQFLRIKPFCEWQKWRLDISSPLKSGRDAGKDKAMRMLQAVCKATMLRRTKTSEFEGQPILKLPERTQEDLHPEFDEHEKNFYESLEGRTQLQFNKYWQEGTVGRHYSYILVLLLRLRQACCHPHLIKDFGVSAAADVSQKDLLEFARELEPAVVDRIKQTGGNFECPVCYDAAPNPAIFIPCGHDTCSDCFARIVDPSNAIRDGNENATGAKCPNCRAPIDPKRITDFTSFKKVYMPELLSDEDRETLREQHGDDDNDDESDDGSGDDETDSDDDADDVDAKGNLKDFVVGDDEDEDSETESEAEEAEEGIAGPSQSVIKFEAKSKGKGKKSKPSKKSKGKGKGKKKQKKEVTLAELKKLATRNAKAKRAYLRRLRIDWISSAKIEKTLEKLREIMYDPEREKVLIFSQWTSLLDLLEVPIDKEGWGYRRYDGSMNAKLRADAVDDFRDHKKDVRIMLVSLKAGNAG